MSEKIMSISPASNTRRRLLIAFTIFCALLITLCPAGRPGLAVGQDNGVDKPNPDGQAKRAREYASQMLDEIYRIMTEDYYDESFHGIDLKKRIKEAKDRLKTLEFNWQMYRVPAQVLLELNDSHTFLGLPRTDNFDYGVRWQMIGGNCFVTNVNRKSDAFKQGIEPGDQILKIGKAVPNRADLWKINFVLYNLDPAKVIELTIRKIDQTEKTVRIAASTTRESKFWNDVFGGQETKRDIFKCAELGPEVIACKLYSFVIENKDIDKMMKLAAKYPNLILDMRGNSGGLVSAEEKLLGYFFETEVKIADMVKRSKTEPRMSKPASGDKVYKGKVTVLIDSDSASAAEVTARVLQLEKRAIIYGDYSSGSVMTSIQRRIRLRSITQRDNAQNLSPGMSVTIGDVLMNDGSRLEHTGVTPDKVLLPGSVALQMKMDPVLAYAAIAFGVKLSPIDAGKLHFLTEQDDDTKDSKSAKVEKPKLQ
jgi:C-terminal processing protease CtpA/Prc